MMIDGQIPVEEYDTGNTKHKWDVDKLKRAHRVVVEYSYKKGEIQKGFADRTLYINLSTNEIKEKKVIIPV